MLNDGQPVHNSSLLFFKLILFLILLILFFFYKKHLLNIRPKIDWKKIYHTNINQKEGGVTKLLEKVEFEVRRVKKSKEKMKQNMS